MDTKIPEDRLRFIIQSCKLDALAVAFPSLLPPAFLSADAPDIHLFVASDVWPELAEFNSENLDLPISPESPFLIQLTSGSTGIPKGSLHHHRGWCNAVAPGRMLPFPPLPSFLLCSIPPLSPPIPT
jgi:acyl-coenzyme A synthetase/AMP-(fatty) acid ligase